MLETWQHFHEKEQGHATTKYGVTYTKGTFICFEVLKVLLHELNTGFYNIFEILRCGFLMTTSS